MRIVGTIARTGLGCALTSLGVLGTLSFQAGVAQAAASPQMADAVMELEEIVVTARRREESLQDTPVAVTVITSEMLDSMQIVGTTDLDKFVPNLQFHS
jgi:iron complex outermembrane receptor protein